MKNDNKKNNNKNTKNNSTKNSINSNVKNNSKNSNSENKNKLKKDDLTLTKQQYFNFETNNIEEEDRPTSNNKNKKIKKQKIVVVEKKVYPKFLLFILFTMNFCLIMSGLYHFNTFDHNKIKTIVKKVVVKEKLDNNYVFLGDSITNRYNLNKYYENMPVVNSGIGGNMTDHILKDMSNRVYIYNPSKVFLLIGTNDINMKQEDYEIVENVKKIIKEIQKNRPNCKIYLESIYPINASENEKIKLDIVESRSNDRIKGLNKKLKILAKELNIQYINMYDELIGKDDNLKLEYTTEGLHLSDDGYKKVTEVLMKYIKE